MFKFIYFLPITIILSACGGGSDISEEEAMIHELEQKAMDHNISTGEIRSVTILPVVCDVIPSPCV